MDPTTVLSDDDDYDVISNQSLESSVADISRTVFEPSPTSVALTKFETARFTAEEIQANVRRALDGSSKPRAGERPQLFADNKTIRVYVDGTFDIFNVGHALQLRQAKLAFPSVYLLVGVFSDQLMASYGYTSLLPHVERCELVRHCRWVDEVVSEAPWIVSHEFLDQHKIQYICVEEGITVDPSCDKARLRGYDEIKSLGKAITTRRTIGLVSAARIATCPSTPTIHLDSLPRTLSSASLHTRAG
ncbi:choline-phosphate cytidylyltransferase [Amanita rubescens]|nr:choline-phosphate cytidylyltransferase [Amanita rubescens]